MPRRIAVFDTNIYIGLGAARAAELARRQRAASVISGASVWTVAELASHLADPTDPRRGRCLGALRALWQHYALYDGSKHFLPFVPDTEDILCRELFGRDTPGRAEEIDAGGAFVRRVAMGDADELNELSPALAGLRDHIAHVEAEFVAAMRDIVQHLDPRASGWETFRSDPERRRAILARIDAGHGLRYFAEALVRRAAASIGTAIEGADLQHRVEFVMRHFGTPLRFFDAIIRKLVDGGVDMSKPQRANSIWDLQIAFYGVPGWAIDGAPLILVTDEGAIREAARRAGDASATMSLNEFTASL
jgi:hypothetical protein